MVQDFSYQKRHSIKCWVVALPDASRICWGTMNIKSIKIGFKFDCSFSFQIDVQVPAIHFRVGSLKSPSPIFPQVPTHRRRDSVMTSTKLKDTTKMSRTFQYISYKKIEWKKFLIGWRWVNHAQVGKISASSLSGGWTSLFWCTHTLGYVPHCTPASRDDRKISLSPSDSS